PPPRSTKAPVLPKVPLPPKHLKSKIKNASKNDQNSESKRNSDNPPLQDTRYGDSLDIYLHTDKSSPKNEPTVNQMTISQPRFAKRTYTTAVDPPTPDRRLTDSLLPPHKHHPPSRDGHQAPKLRTFTTDRLFASENHRRSQMYYEQNHRELQFKTKEEIIE